MVAIPAPDVDILRLIFLFPGSVPVSLWKQEFYRPVTLNCYVGVSSPVTVKLTDDTPRNTVGLRSIGAPDLNRDSPTRTVRATRLRHAPREE